MDAKKTETPELAAVRDALAEKLFQIADVEAAAPAAALRIALGKPEDGDQDIIDRLAALRGEADTLRLAIDGAEQAEAERRKAERDRARQAAGNACRQFLGKFDRATKQAAEAIAALNVAYQEMTVAIRSAFGTHPALVGNFSYLGPRVIRRAFLAESIRHARARGIEPFAESKNFIEEFTDRQGRINDLISIYGRATTQIRAALPPIERKSNSSPAAAAVEEDAEAGGGSSPTSPASATIPAGDAPERELTDTERLILEEHKKMGLAS